jgi:GH43 family beta-xylosidase
MTTLVRVTRYALPAALLLAAGCSGCSGGGTRTTAPPPTTCTFTNPLAPGADPWVVRNDGSYYLVQSRDNGIWVSKSSALTGLFTGAVKVWSAPSSGWNRANIWAPELHYIDGKWYIYYAAGPSGTAPATFVNQRSFVLESVSADPQGAYVDKGMLLTDDDGEMVTDNKWAIDLTVERLNGQLYAVWSGWEQNSTTTDRVTQHLYIAPMSNPWTISGNRVKLSSPVESWERGTELDLEEGPEFLQHGGQVFIIYSTRESFLPDYRLGQLRLSSPTANPLDPASWTKSGPVFTGAGTVYGVGHASFTVSPDGTESWIVYHSKTVNGPGWDDRYIRMQKFGWNADGSPAFGTPVAAGLALAVPSGQCT